MKKLFLLLNLFVTASFSHAFTEDGQVTNGGDPYAAEFFLLLDSSLAKMPLTLPLNSGGVLERSDLETVRRTVQVTSEESLTLKGREVGAINRPFTNPPSIVLSRTFWNKLDLDQKLHLVLHETLPVAGVFDADYKNSSTLVQLIENIAPISYPTLLASVETCDQSFIESISGATLQSLITPQQQSSVLFHALDYKCAPMIKKFHEWQINMDICMGSLSLMNWFLRTDIRNLEKVVEVIQILKSGGVSTLKTCARKVNDSCKFAEKLPDKESLLPALQCK
ncbi:hypothetical protein [Bdellovibrio sp. HCB337]|uniref:hypothetical protein n=1 Tax=Bdellovibrio sp. HCB337 TaxID=3394358 RepID=UPI0039A71841